MANSWKEFWEAHIKEHPEHDTFEIMKLSNDSFGVGLVCMTEAAKEVLK